MWCTKSSQKGCEKDRAVQCERDQFEKQFCHAQNYFPNWHLFIANQYYIVLLVDQYTLYYIDYILNFKIIRNGVLHLCLSYA